ncbi:MAG: hypothetical protein JNK78_19495 [Planctomycetes bacterium]|nr:hypothetical protein [Planctomycetota bacterium]
MKTLLLLSCSLAAAALSAQSPRPDDPALQAKTSLSRVVFDRPRADGPLWACGNAWKASFDGHGFTTIPFFGSKAPHNFPLRLEVAAATVGGETLLLGEGQPETVGPQVVTRRSAFTEVIDARLDSLEQSFVFDHLPNRGAIAVDVRIGGDGYEPSTIDGGLRFSTEFGHVDYTKAVAIDGNGRRLALPINWTGDAAHLEIPASFVESAALPIVLDPTLNYWWGLGNPSILQHDGDVAAIQTSALNGRTLLVWQRQWSATDQDCWGLLFDNDLNLVQTDFTIDFTAEDWLKVAVAANNYAQNFLVVSEVRIGLLWFIAGRTVASNAVLGTQFDIEREGVVGTAGNNFHPDVGGDPYFGPGRYTVVFNKKTLGVSDIYMKQVTPAGGLVTTNAIAIGNATVDEIRPSISKSCGPASGVQQYLVTWQRTWQGVPNDQEVWGRFVGWNGALNSGQFAIAFTTAEETAPSSSSPIDVNGQRSWPVCWEVTGTVGNPRDVVGKVLAADGTSQASFVASNNVPGADDREPEVDSDGIRFVIGLTTGSVGFPQSVEAVTLAFLPGTSSVRVEERTGMNTSAGENYAQCNVVGEFSGGGSPSSRYKVCFTEQTPNTLRLANHGGWAGGNASYFTRPTQCGTLSIAASGLPMLGQTVTVTVGNGSLSATIGGFPITAPLFPVFGCNCTLGVDPIAFFPNPFVYAVPADPTLVGGALAVQGFTFVGSSCLGSIDFSDTIDFSLH